MAMLADPMKTTTVSHMGAEGIMWLGQQPFTDEKHVFANLGDGTYAHSGFLAVRQAVAAHVPITYKILFNGFVAMTGGQAVDAELAPAQIVNGLVAEGVRKLAIVTDDPEKYQGVSLAAEVSVHHRSELDAVQTSFRQYADVSVILYDQPCATERRRLRKRGHWEDPAKRLFIHAPVCEGCGDCGIASNCMSIEPMETELGRKRQINQGTCNKDFSCVEGFCPSFVTVVGGRLKPSNATQRKQGGADRFPEWSGQLPAPPGGPAAGVHNVLVAGIGGTGIVTIGQTLAMAAHIEGLFSSNLDVTGLAQKYGAVHSHVRWAVRPDMLHATRIASNEAHALLGCDLIVAASDASLNALNSHAGQAVVCSDLIPTGEFARNPDWSVDGEPLVERIRVRAQGRALVFEGRRLATALMGDPIATNMLVLGAAWQRGMVPLSLTAIDKAIELNGVAVTMNRQAFEWGRRASVDLEQVEAIAAGRGHPTVVQFVPRKSSRVDDVVAHRIKHLQAYGSRKLVEKYQRTVQRVRAVESRVADSDALTKSVAHNYHRLLAVKDEWEVARLYAAPEFQQSLDRQFESGQRLKFHLGAGLFARRNKATGVPQKREVGDWILPVFRVLARLRTLRGTVLDPFRWGTERRLERAWLLQYEGDLDRLLSELTPANHALAVRIASVPDSIRGFGHVKERRALRTHEQRAALWVEWNLPSVPAPMAA